MDIKADKRHPFAEINEHSTLVHKAQKSAVARKARAARGAYKRTKQQRQAERDEIADYIARVPPRNY